MKDASSIYQIVKAMRMLTMFNMKQFTKNIHSIAFKYKWLYGLVKHLNLLFEKPVKRVFFAHKEIFSSSFSSFDITENDCVIGNLGKEYETLNDVMNELIKLQNEYNIQYYVLNSNTNEVMQVLPEIVNIQEIQYDEINHQTLLQEYLKVERLYAYMMGELQMNSYRIGRMQNAEDNLENKIQQEQILKRKKRAIKMQIYEVQK